MAGDGAVTRNLDLHPRTRCHSQPVAKGVKRTAPSNTIISVESGVARNKNPCNHSRYAGRGANLRIWSGTESLTTCVRMRPTANRGRLLGCDHAANTSSDSKRQEAGEPSLRE